MPDDSESYQLKAVVAMASNRVIGRDGQLPWHLPEDLKLFKRTTLGHPILMGRKTYESIGRPLPKRRNIVLSRCLVPADGVEVIRDLAELDSLGLSGDVFVIGGTQLYTALLPRCGEILLSYIHEAHDGDTRFPEFEGEFELVASEAFEGFELRRYVRRVAADGQC